MRTRAPLAVLNEVTHRTHRLPILMVVATTRCQSRCVSCGYRSQGTDLTREDISPWLPLLGRLETRVLVFTGGEPLLHPQLFEYAEVLLGAAGGRPSCRSWLLTNGLALDREAERVRAAFDRVTLSLDGWDRESYRQIRGVDGWEALRRGCQALQRADSRPRLEARVTVHAANAGRLDEIVRAALALGIEGVSFVLADERDHAFGDPAARRTPDWQEETLLDLETSLRRLEAQRSALPEGLLLQDDRALRMLGSRARALSVGDASAPRCNAPWVSAVLEPGGTVRPCFFQPAYAGSGPPALLGASGIRARRGLIPSEDPICSGCTCALHIRKRRLLM